MNGKRFALLLLAMVTLAGCATMPTGPSVKVMPGPGKPFEAFQADDASCKQWAQKQISEASPRGTANKNTAIGAAVGTAIGAAMGAALGAATGDAGVGAAIGGAVGLVGGLVHGSGQGAVAERQLQRQYDNAYTACMYAKGHQTPGLPVQAENQPAAKENVTQAEKQSADEETVEAPAVNEADINKLFDAQQASR